MFELSCLLPLSNTSLTRDWAVSGVVSAKSMCNGCITNTLGRTPTFECQLEVCLQTAHSLRRLWCLYASSVLRRSCLHRRRRHCSSESLSGTVI